MIYIGTSGWSYKEWKNKFYPKNTPTKNFLKYYSKTFNTAEVNSSFYHLPKKQTLEKWKETTNKDFLFSLKASRFITHIKRLKTKTPWNKFKNTVITLKNNLGPILFQFPKNFHAKEETKNNIEDFIKYIRKDWRTYKIAFEFRHDSWFNEQNYKMLRKHNISLVIADSSQYPRKNISTADFAYFRYHGPTTLFSSKYTKNQLKKEKEIINKIKKRTKDIFIYFNNDVNAYAPQNAQELMDILKKS
ncbi:MAG: DUF72 domain-containing protein [Candidatus Portnoybacteria bacterium]|nr:DUF72 domain-containing protein [Candidatus Portnoybacteria bacterium]